MKRIAVFVFLCGVAALVLAGCSQSAGPRLRIRNSGTVPIENLSVLFPEEEVTFGTVAPGATTEYKQFARGVYGYGAYRYTAGGEQVTQPVIDWVGEVPMPGTDFTYTISYDPARPAMQRITLVDVTRDN
jgi:hypothetical protein